MSTLPRRSRPYAHLAGDLSGWPKGTVPSPAVLRNLDQFSSELVDGEDGGDYEPENPIVLGPGGDVSGVAHCMRLDAGSFSGDIETVKGNKLAGDDLGEPGLILLSGAVPTLQSARTRTVVVPFTFQADAVSGTTPAGLDFSPFYEIDPVTLGIKLITSVSGARMFNVPLPLRGQHRGATIDHVDFEFIVAGTFAAVPADASKSRFRVLKVGSGDAYAALHTASVGAYDSGGWLIDPAATLATFTNNGKPRTATYACDQNNTGLDPDASFFMLQARLGQGAGPGVGSVMLCARVYLTAISDFRQE